MFGPSQFKTNLNSQPLGRYVFFIEPFTSLPYTRTNETILKNLKACTYNPDIEGDFIAFHLGPKLSETHPDVKLFIFDHNKDHGLVWMLNLLDPNNPAAKFIDGTGIHWYAGGMDRLLDGAVGTPNMHKMVDSNNVVGRKNQIILGTEACHCPSTYYAGGDISIAWARAERYAHTILADLAAGSNGWIEWNLM